MPNHLVGGTNGGMTVYYLPGSPPFDQEITAFPKVCKYDPLFLPRALADTLVLQGFRMITGNPFLRDGKPTEPDGSVESYALSFRCWEDQEWLGESNQHAPGIGKWDTVHLPKKFCPGGIRSNTFFPS